ncbi:DUF4159 domain-containing protein [Entomobacter blattae]|uniref:DUF4159 domain-containing protein n=1 Tax=Entomobacter blattae TaxID=2762277 RepID=A0A7H1NNC8_9PROT|nr:DUF4159 domain-containing protein [Entomobacter blattae]QNT77288.1 hypothetical protein JGUZn3_00210 [Entomobacter blattae]
MTFLKPLLLMGLAILPIIWYLLYIRPPAARKQIFPAIMLVRLLPLSQQTPYKSSLWRLFLRCIAVTLLVLGFAEPVVFHQNNKEFAFHKTALIVIDNGWASIHDWQKRKETLNTLLNKGLAEQQKILLLATAPTEGNTLLNIATPQTIPESQPILNLLHPEPWPTERKMAAEALEKIHAHYPDLEVFYLADGLQSADDKIFKEKLHLFSTIHDIRLDNTVLEPASPFLLYFPQNEKDFFTTGRIGLSVIAAAFPRHFSISFQGANAHNFTTKTVIIPPGQSTEEIHIDLPPPILRQIEKISLDNTPTPSSTLLLNRADFYHPVGLLGEHASQTPFVGSLYYVQKALLPYADLHTGNLTQLLNQKLSVIIAPDGSLNSAETRTQLAQWVKNGGMLIRFGGEGLTANAEQNILGDSQLSPGAHNPETTLLPVPLISGSRQLGSGMSWGKPQKLAAFNPHSPFAGLPIPTDITVSRQILAEPSSSLTAHIWAQLEDGTPLVTHTTLGQGQMVFFHLPATPGWSNLPLSGVFVSMLQRLVGLANGVLQQSHGNAILPPLSILDENANLITPPAFALALAENQFGQTPVSYLHPAGIYGSAAVQKKLNIGDTLKHLEKESLMGQAMRITTSKASTSYASWLIILGGVLLLIDGFIRLFVPFSPKKHAKTLGIFSLFLAIILPLSSTLAATPLPVPPAALETRLAYLLTGDPETDTTSEQGLIGLSHYVNSRTSATLGHPDGVVPEKDDLAFYPLLYWPITPQAKTNPARIAALNRFISHGGIILIDTMGTDAEQAETTSSSIFINFVPHTTATLKNATEGLNIPTLTKLTPNHVLAHTFYLLHNFPGRYTGAPLWVAHDENAGNDGVSPIIIGANSWAQAWAITPEGEKPFSVLPGGEIQRRQAFRFGVNLVIYSLTGNYKADQSHVPELLKRLNNDAR